MIRPDTTTSSWLNRFAVFTAVATLGLLCIGGLVTSHGVGMAVPDWPTSYGYNMFALPWEKWKMGGIFYEHTHRLWASTVGVLVVFLTRWLGGWQSRRPLAVVGLTEVLAGVAITALYPELRKTGQFLTGIGGVVLLAALVWTRNGPASTSLVRLGWTAFWLIQLQGLLGGLRVVLFQSGFGIFHAVLAQVFFLLVCVIAFFTSRWSALPSPLTHPSDWGGEQQPDALRKLRAVALLTTGLILFQLILGATMRHQHAGLAIPDFPMAYGKLWPAMDAKSVAGYNQQRMEVTAANPITSFQIGLQMAHRLVALAILVCVGAVAWQAQRWSSRFSVPLDKLKLEFQRAGSETGAALRRLARVWLALILVQAGLGAWTIWSNKAADVATAHVLVGALSLVTGALWCIIAFRRSPGRPEAKSVSSGEAIAESAREYVRSTVSCQGDPAMMKK